MELEEKWEKVVVALNHQRHGWLALAYALAKEEIKAGDSVLLCHVAKGNKGNLFRIGGGGDGEKNVKDMELRLATMAEMLTNDHRLHVETRLQRGDVAGQIIAAVNSFQATKLVMGSESGQHGKPQKGSMSRKVVDAVKHKCTIIIATKEEELYVHTSGGPPSSRQPSEHSTPNLQPNTMGHGSDQGSGELLTLDLVMSEDMWPSAWQNYIKLKIRELQHERDQARDKANREEMYAAEKAARLMELLNNEVQAQSDLESLQRDATRIRRELDERQLLVDRAQQALQAAQQGLEESDIRCASLMQAVEAAEKKRESLEKELDEVTRMCADLEQRLTETLTAHEIVTLELTEEQKAHAQALIEGAREREEMQSQLENDRREAERRERELRRDQLVRQYTYEDLVLATGNFEESRKLGEGGFGEVFQGTIRMGKVAIKKLHRDSMQGVQELQNEIEVLGSNRHQHIVMLYGACLSHNCLVYEFMEHGNLEDRIRSERRWGPLLWDKRITILHQVAKGLFFLHTSKPPVIHRDLKPANILLDAHDVAKIGDVGLAKMAFGLQPNGRSRRSVIQDSGAVGTWHYIDPEYERKRELGPKSDVYALGIIMLEMLTGKCPGESISMFENYDANSQSGVSLREKLDRRAGPWGREIAERLQRLAWKCRSHKREHRPELIDVLQELEDMAAATEQLTQQRSLSFPSHLDNHVRDSIICPITWEIMSDPVIAMDGQTYEKDAIETWLTQSDISPWTLLAMEKTLIPNHRCRSLILALREREQERANRAISYQSGSFRIQHI